MDRCIERYLVRCTIHNTRHNETQLQKNIHLLTFTVCFFSCATTSKSSFSSSGSDSFSASSGNKFTYKKGLQIMPTRQSDVETFPHRNREYCPQQNTKIHKTQTINCSQFLTLFPLSSKATSLLSLGLGPRPRLY